MGATVTRPGGRRGVRGLQKKNLLVGQTESEGRPEPRGWDINPQGQRPQRGRRGSGRLGGWGMDLGNACGVTQRRWRGGKSRGRERGRRRGGRRGGRLGRCHVDGDPTPPRARPVWPRSAQTRGRLGAGGTVLRAGRKEQPQPLTGVQAHRLVCRAQELPPRPSEVVTAEAPGATARGLGDHAWRGRVRRRTRGAAWGRVRRRNRSTAWRQPLGTARRPLQRCGRQDNGGVRRRRQGAPGRRARFRGSLRRRRVNSMP